MIARGSPKFLPPPTAASLTCSWSGLSTGSLVRVSGGWSDTSSSFARQASACSAIRNRGSIQVDQSANSSSLSSHGSPNRSGSGSGNGCAPAKPVLELRASTSDVAHGWLTSKRFDGAVWLERDGGASQKP